MALAKKCLRAHYYGYELMISKDNIGEPLRVGSAFHLGADMLAKGHSLDDVLHTIRTSYSLMPVWVQTPDDEREWHTECEYAVAIVAAYHWRWQNSEIKVIATEQEFEIPLVNPETGAASRIWTDRGKIDKIVELPDGRLAVEEHKTTSDSIDTDSDYWKRLRLDSQISRYVLAARSLGYDVQTVIYDVVRKPAHSPCQIPILDKNGLKIVTDADGNRICLANGKPRQAADREKGWTLKTRVETPEEYGQRVYRELYQNYDKYFARREIPRLESDLDEFRMEMWQQQKLIRWCQNTGVWFRNTDACLHPYRCEFADICLNNVNPLVNLPAGYIKREQVHPELSGAIA